MDKENSSECSSKLKLAKDVATQFHYEVLVEFPVIFRLNMTQLIKLGR